MSKQQSPRLRSRLFIRGYCDEPSVAPGEIQRFYVSTDEPCRCEVQLVRLLHGDLSQDGPGYREVPIDVPLNGSHDCVPQRTQSGGYVEIPDERGALGGGSGLTMHVHVWSTLTRGVQTILSRAAARDAAGWRLLLDEGFPVLELGDGKGRTVRVRSDRRLFVEQWYSLAAGFDPPSGRLFISQQVKTNRVNSRLGHVTPLDTDATVVAGDAFVPAIPAVPVVVAGTAEAAGDARTWVIAPYNGKIDAPKVYAGCASDEAIAALHATGRLRGPRLLAHWDFSAEIGRAGVPSDRISDVSGNGLDGRCVNQPDRGMTGWNWDGSEEHYVHCPSQYGAIWFHEDSLDDCRWSNPLELIVPADLASGTYALRVRHGTYEDHIPFVVTPPRGTASADIVVVLPTLSYLAYANSQDMQSAPSAQAIMGVISTLEDRDLELHETTGIYGLSTYDYHVDGRGVQYSSWRRPLLSMRPRYRHEFGSMWQFPADLHLIDWLDARGFKVDVVTDHDLVREGVALLARYKVMVTGTHPEYTTASMLDAFEDYLAGGGRGMYLAANGFYWVASVHPAKPWVMEVRKGEAGTQAWRARPGEYHHATTGERGGLWRQRARAPQKIWGTGMSSHGLDISAGYVQLPDARDPRVGWIFDGVGPDEIIGDFGLVNGGAAGLEMDVIDPALGTPPHTLLLASSHGHSANAVVVPEEQYFPHAGMTGIEHPLVRADIVYFTTPHGGAVFSTSSMTWSGSLSHNGYDNNVSRITANVLRRFADPAPLEEVV